MLLLSRPVRCAARFILFFAAAGVALPTQAQTKTWDGGAGTLSWHDDSNWNPDGVPGPSDDVLIDVPSSITVTHTTGTHTINSLVCAETLAISDGTLNINAASIVSGTLDLSYAARLGGSGNVTVTGTMTWSSGSVDGSGQLIIEAGATLNMTNTAHQLARTLINNGTINHSGGHVFLYSGTLINNGQYNITSADLLSFQATDGTSVITNTGTVTKSGGGYTLINGQSEPLTFNNLGTMIIDGGTMDIYTGGTHTGPFVLTSGAVLMLNYTHAFSETAAISGNGNLVSWLNGTRTFNSDVTLTGDVSIEGTNIFNGTLRFGGTLLVHGGTTTMNNTFSPGDATIIESGTLNINDDQTVPALNLTGGVLDGSGNVLVTGAMLWSYGRMQGSGQTIIDTDAMLNINSSVGTRNLRRTLINNGTVNHTAGDVIFDSGIGTLINNNQYNVASDGTVSYLSQGGTGGFSNNGTVHISDGVLRLLSGGIHTGPFTVHNGSTLTFGGAHNLSPAASITGVGNVVCETLGLKTFNGDVTLAGNCTFLAGTNTFNGTVLCSGTVTVDSTGTTTIGNAFSPSAVLIDNGILNVNADQMWPTLSLTGGVLGGSGNVRVTGTAIWSSGRMQASGQTIIDAGATLHINNSTGMRNLRRTLINNGTINHTAGNVLFDGGGGSAALINNNQYNVTSSNTLTYQATSSTTGAITNAGAFTKSGSGTMNVSVSSGVLTFSNIGTANLNAGTLNISSGVAQYASNTLTDGIWNIAANSTLTFPASASIQTVGPGTTVKLSGAASNFPAINALTTINDGASFELAGGRDLATMPNGGMLSNNGTLTLGPDCDLSITGAYAQGATGNLNLDYSAISGAAVAATTGVSLDGELDLDYVSGFGPPIGANLVLVSTSGGNVSGEFASASLPPRAGGPLTQNTLVYNSTNVALSYAHNPGAFIGDSGETWFDSANWGVGSLPTSSTDVLLNVQVMVDQLGAIARNVNILDQGELLVGSNLEGTGGSLDVAEVLNVETGGTLTLDDNSTVTATGVVVQTGGTLNVIAPSALLNVGDLTMDAGSTLNWTAGTITIDGGAWSNPVSAIIEVGCDSLPASLALLNGATVSAATVNICADGALEGDGSVNAALVNAGTVRPGDGIGTLIAGSTYAQSPIGELALDLAGLAAGTQHDVLTVVGAATLDGDASVNLLNGFVPAPGDDFEVLTADALTGTFAAIVGTPTSCGKVFGASYTATAASIETLYDPQQPDCNNNGVPDACDILNQTSPDCNTNNVPDECDIVSSSSPDCNGNNIPDECDIANDPSIDCNRNGVPDSCDLVSGYSVDLNNNGIPDDCEECGPGDYDCNGAVNTDDLIGIILAWGSCRPNLACPGDVFPHPDGDGEVDVDDLLAVILSWR